MLQQHEIVACRFCRHYRFGVAAMGKRLIPIWDGRELCVLHSDQPPAPAKNFPLQLQLRNFDTGTQILPGCTQFRQPKLYEEFAKREAARLATQQEAPDAAV